MNKTKLFSIILYVVVALITAGMGIRFLTATEYFTYHSQASGIAWTDVNSGLRIVYMAIFKVCGAGFLSIALSLLLMIIFPFTKYNNRWSYFAIPACGVVFWSIVLAATIYVSLTTQATTPWGGSLFCVISTFLAFILSLFSIKKTG